MSAFNGYAHCAPIYRIRINKMEWTRERKKNECINVNWRSRTNCTMTSVMWQRKHAHSHMQCAHILSGSGSRKLAQQRVAAAKTEITWNMKTKKKKENKSKFTFALDADLRQFKCFLSADTYECVEYVWLRLCTYFGVAHTCMYVVVFFFCFWWQMQKATTKTARKTVLEKQEEKVANRLTYGRTCTHDFWLGFGCNSFLFFALSVSFCPCFSRSFLWHLCFSCIMCSRLSNTIHAWHVHCVFC